MLNDFQDQGPSPFFRDGEEESQDNSGQRGKFNITRWLSGSILGLKPPQLFVLLIMLLVVVCLLGSLFLLITGKLAAPFL